MVWNFAGNLLKHNSKLRACRRQEGPQEQKTDLRVTLRITGASNNFQQQVFRTSGVVSQDFLLDPKITTQFLAQVSFSIPLRFGSKVLVLGQSWRAPQDHLTNIYFTHLSAYL